MLALRNNTDLTLTIPRDLIQIRMDPSKLNLNISPTVSKLKLLHKDSNKTVGKPLTIPNTKAIGKVIGVVITNTRFKKINYKFREQEDLSFTKAPITLKSEREDTHQLFDVLKITDRRVFEDPSKEELIRLF